jgi:hypothetical protein
MSTKSSEPVQEPKAKPPITRRYHFPDIAGDGQPVAIEASSLEEATKLYHEQKGSAPAHR